MIALADLLRDVSGQLGAHGYGFALVGGLAVSAWTDPRFTRDVDLAVAVPDDAAAEALIGELSATFRPLSVVEHQSLGRLAMVRLGSTGQGADHAAPVVDLLFASSGIEAEVVAAATPVEVLPGVIVPLARVGHLIALKVLSVEDRRRLDEQDLISLLDVAGEADLWVATQAVDLITARGANRGRDLATDLATLLDRFGTPPTGPPP